MLRSLDAVRTALDTCTFCPKLCRFACPVATAEGRETVTPWALMTRANRVRLGQAPLDVPTASAWEHCTGCGRCVRNCKHGNDVPRALWAARTEAARAGLASPALLAWAEAPRPDAPAFEALPEGGDVLLLPGHAPAESVAAAVTLLRAALGVVPGRPYRGVFCAGGRELAAGRPKRFADEAARVRRGLDGARTVVCLDPDDAVTLTRELPRHGGPLSARVVPLAEAVVAGLAGRLAPVVDGDVLYLDACRLGRGLGVYDAPRRLLAATLAGGRVREAVMNRDQGGCCGAGAGFAAAWPEDAAAVAREAASDGPDLPPDIPIVIASPVCATHLRAALGPGRTVHDWAVLVARALQEESP